MQGVSAFVVVAFLCESNSTIGITFPFEVPLPSSPLTRCWFLAHDIWVTLDRVLNFGTVGNAIARSFFRAKGSICWKLKCNRCWGFSNRWCNSGWNFGVNWSTEASRLRFGKILTLWRFSTDCDCGFNRYVSHEWLPITVGFFHRNICNAGEFSCNEANSINACSCSTSETDQACITKM